MAAGRDSRSVEAINRRLASGDAVVMTAQEFKQGLRRGRRYSLAEVDVVTAAMREPMSGTAAWFSIPVAERGVFLRAEQAWLNGVPARPGPAPNERLGYVDVMVNGNAASRDDPSRYGGGHLFRDLLEGREIHIEILTEAGRALDRRFTLADIDFARMHNTRSAAMAQAVLGNFKSAEPVRSVFGFRPMGRDSGLTAIGSGELLPLQNDPGLRTIRVGTRVLLNDAPGLVVGHGSRASAAMPNLSIVADMFKMDPRYMGGFMSCAGVDALNAVAVPIPVQDEAVLEALTRCLDENIAVPVADISDRQTLAQIRSADIWRPSEIDVGFDPARACSQCREVCAAEAVCPVGAIAWSARRLDADRCIACGACAALCTSGAFTADLGGVDVLGQRQPIIFRLGDRKKSAELAERLKAKLLGGEFLLSAGAEDIRFRR